MKAEPSSRCPDCDSPDKNWRTCVSNVHSRTGCGSQQTPCIVCTHPWHSQPAPVSGGAPPTKIWDSLRYMDGHEYVLLAEVRAKVAGRKNAPAPTEKGWVVCEYGCGHGVCRNPDDPSAPCAEQNHLCLPKLEALRLKVEAATPAPPQSLRDSEDAERKAFEKWYEADVMPMEADWFRRDKDGDYEHTPTYDAWRGWMARAASERAQEEEIVLHYGKGPYGHSERFYWTIDGGKHIICLLCERAPEPKWERQESCPECDGDGCNYCASQPTVAKTAKAEEK